jgi:hypothetical protein
MSYASLLHEVKTGDRAREIETEIALELEDMLRNVRRLKEPAKVRRMREVIQAHIRDMGSFEQWHAKLTPENVALIERHFPSTRDFYEWFISRLSEYAGLIV